LPVAEPAPAIAMYAGQTDPRDCPVHGRRAAGRLSTLSNGTRILESRQ
uniref:Rieske (2Fe-2S) protein n=2 Tax=Haemonchus TaxID=6288 RepID=A0A0N4W036_HAEPC